jgi:hypothetical protein
LNGDPTRCRTLFRVTQAQFAILHSWLAYEHSYLIPSRYMTSEEKLGIFLYWIANGGSYRLIREHFQRSTRTISVVLKQVLLAVGVHLYREVVSLPDTSPSTTCDEPHFHLARGAIDGTHIPITVPRRIEARFRNRKGTLTQNVLAVTDFDCNFRFMWAGWEGSAHDARVARDAVLKGGLCAVESSSYYLADAGYGDMNGMLLTPYRRVRYHLNEWTRSGARPENAKELFNLRHARARNVIERTLGI